MQKDYRTIKKVKFNFDDAKTGATLRTLNRHKIWLIKQIQQCSETCMQVIA